jgi:hypothetical protein
LKRFGGRREGEGGQAFGPSPSKRRSAGSLPACSRRNPAVNT